MNQKKIILTLVPKIELVDRHGIPRQTLYEAYLGDILARVFYYDTFDGNSRLTVRSDWAHFRLPVTFCGRIKATEDDQERWLACRLEIKDLKTAYRLWQICHHGYSCWLFKLMIDESLHRLRGGRYTEVEKVSLVRRVVELGEAAFHRSGLRLRRDQLVESVSPPLPKWYTGGQLDPGHIPSRISEKWLTAEMECFFPDGVTKPKLLRAMKDRKVWGVCTKGDGSIQAPAGCLPTEVVLCRPRAAYDAALSKLCAFMKEMGAGVNSSCGMHVHFDFRHSNRYEVESVAKRLEKHFLLAKYLLEPHRRCNSYCLEGLSWTNRYHAINLCAFLRHQTLEIRAHQGTVEYLDIINWIKLLEAMMQVRIGELFEDDQDRTLGAWLDRLNLTPEEKAYWRTEAEKHNTEMPDILSKVLVSRRQQYTPIVPPVADPDPILRAYEAQANMRADQANLGAQGVSGGPGVPGIQVGPGTVLNPRYVVNPRWVQFDPNMQNIHQSSASFFDIFSTMASSLQPQQPDVQDNHI